MIHNKQINQRKGDRYTISPRFFVTHKHSFTVSLSDIKMTTSFLISQHRVIEMSFRAQLLVAGMTSSLANPASSQHVIKSQWLVTLPCHYWLSILCSQEANWPDSLEQICYQSLPVGHVTVLEIKNRCCVRSEAIVVTWRKTERCSYSIFQQRLTGPWTSQILSPIHDVKYSRVCKCLCERSSIFSLGSFYSLQ